MGELIGVRKGTILAVRRGEGSKRASISASMSASLKRHGATDADDDELVQPMAAVQKASSSSESGPTSREASNPGKEGKPHSHYLREFNDAWQRRFRRSRHQLPCW